jgi:hypothetical protein
LPFACVNADAATLLTALDVLGLDNNFEALEAIFDDVYSPFLPAIINEFLLKI